MHYYELRLASEPCQNLQPFTLTLILSLKGEEITGSSLQVWYPEGLTTDDCL